jgi:parallel beta-helix repeat protein
MKRLDVIEPRIAIRAEMLPLTITSPGSYYVAEDISTPGAGIHIQASHVTIDLNGFTLDGGTGHGIWVEAPYERTTIRDGRVSGWTGGGVVLGDFARVENVDSHDNGAQGIFVSAVGIVSGCTASNNATVGIEARERALILNSVAVGNGTDGISAWTGSVIRDCVASANTGNGIYGVDGASVAGCASTSNGRNGIRVDDDSHVWRNVCKGNSTGFADEAGIYTYGNGNRIDENLVAGNPYGITLGGSYNTAVRNTATGNSVGDLIWGWDNDVGPIDAYATATSPWANNSN